MFELLGVSAEIDNEQNVYDARSDRKRRGEKFKTILEKLRNAVQELRLWKTMCSLP
jgi:hypothetical protein